jgi:predicted transcriptional regulator
LASFQQLNHSAQYQNHNCSTADTVLLFRQNALSVSLGNDAIQALLVVMETCGYGDIHVIDTKRIVESVTEYELNGM